MSIIPTDQEFDADGVPLVEAVQDAILPAIRKYGWEAVNDAMYVAPLWDLRSTDLRTGPSLRFSPPATPETEVAG